MKINEYGAVIVNSNELFEYIYSDKLLTFKNIYLENETDIVQFNNSINLNKDNIPHLRVWITPDENIDFFDEANQCDWFMPENYCSNLVELLYDQCQTEIQKSRVDQELQLFIQHGMFDLLFYLKYLVDTMRKHNIVWGIGRGSSVASYILFLIGIHKIDSIKYDLDIKEFFKGD